MPPRINANFQHPIRCTCPATSAYSTACMEKIVIVIVILILIELEEQLYIAIILATKSTRFWVLGPRKAEG